MPTFVNKFIVDFVETAIAALFLLNIVIPNDIDQAKQMAVVVGTAVLGALVSALRRATPDFIGWLKTKLNVS
jgi:hypothetical protein